MRPWYLWRGNAVHSRSRYRVGCLYLHSSAAALSAVRPHPSRLRPCMWSPVMLSRKRRPSQTTCHLPLYNPGAGLASSQYTIELSYAHLRFIQATVLEPVAPSVRPLVKQHSLIIPHSLPHRLPHVFKQGRPCFLPRCEPLAPRTSRKRLYDPMPRELLVQIGRWCHHGMELHRTGE